MKQTTFYKQPTVTTNHQGNLRKVGFEIEFTGLDLNQTIALVEEAFHARRKEQSVARGVVEAKELGDFTIELDWHYLKQKAMQTKKTEPDVWLELLGQAATLLVPMEVVCPPVPINQLDLLDPLTEKLRSTGAIGTDDSLISAYGVHINAEIPHLAAADLFNFLRAFSLLQWWLVDAHQVDFSRRVSPYVDLYPEGYVRLLLERTAPDLQILMNDYLYYNASRNRALDLLPLLAEIDPERVQKATDDVKIKPRPALHYRLPDCRIDKPDWSLATSWNTWWVVEELAQRPDDLSDLSREFLSQHRPLLGVSRSNWTAHMDLWLKNHALA